LAAIKKAKEKGLSEKEIEKKINSVKNCIKTLDLKKGKVVYKND
jgi:hypothetical protein